LEKLIILIPVYNDWKSLNLLIKKIYFELNKRNLNSEILIISAIAFLFIELIYLLIENIILLILINIILVLNIIIIIYRSFCKTKNINKINFTVKKLILFENRSI
jgi:hypothetical protein